MPSSSCACHCPSPSLLDDATTNGTITLSFHGSRYSLGFRGTPDFIERMVNLCYNRGMINSFARVHHPYDSKSFGYVVVEKVERITRAFASQIRSDMVMSGEVKPVVDEWRESGEGEGYTCEGHALEFNEKILDARARERAKWFMQNVVKRDHFMTALNRENKGYFPPTFDVGNIRGSLMREE